MEMPEGWKDIKLRMTGPEGFPIKPKVDMALILMKEMAESLDDCYENDLTWKQRIALQRFKEWKK